MSPPPWHGFVSREPVRRGSTDVKRSGRLVLRLQGPATALAQSASRAEEVAASSRVAVEDVLKPLPSDDQGLVLVQGRDPTRAGDSPGGGRVVVPHSRMV